MNLKLKIGLLVIGIILVLAALNFLGQLYFLNYFVSGTPDKSCNSDADCEIKATSCGVCQCKDAVNKGWNVLCPFRIQDTLRFTFSPPFLYYVGGVRCECLPLVDYDYVKCVENRCQIIKNFV